MNASNLIIHRRLENFLRITRRKPALELQASIANSIQFEEARRSKANHLEFSRETANPSQGGRRKSEGGAYFRAESGGNFENALNLKAFICNRIITRAGLR